MPRSLAAGADINKIIILTTIPTSPLVVNGRHKDVAPLTLPDHIPQLAALVREQGARLSS